MSIKTTFVETMTDAQVKELLSGYALSMAIAITASGLVLVLQHAAQKLREEMVEIVPTDESE